MSQATLSFLPLQTPVARRRLPHFLLSAGSVSLGRAYHLLQARASCLLLAVGLTEQCIPLPVCLSWAYYDSDEAQGPKRTLGGKSLFGLHFHTIAYHRRESGQELKQGQNLEAGADAEARGVWLTGLLITSCPVCFLIEPRTTSLGMASPTVDCALLHQSLIKKTPSSWISWEHFLN